MGFRRSDLQEAFYVPGTHEFRVWGYGTSDPLDEVLKVGYFAEARGLLRPGALIYVSMRPRSTRTRGAAPGETRMALVMVRARQDNAAAADGSVRLVQDFGRPTDRRWMVDTPEPDELAPPAAAKRGRGRPRASRDHDGGHALAIDFGTKIG